MCVSSAFVNPSVLRCSTVKLTVLFRSSVNFNIPIEISPASPIVRVLASPSPSCDLFHANIRTCFHPSFLRPAEPVSDLDFYLRFRDTWWPSALDYAKLQLFAWIESAWPVSWRRVPRKVLTCAHGSTDIAQLAVWSEFSTCDRNFTG